MTGYGYAAIGVIAAGFAAYAADVWRCRRRRATATPAPQPAPITADPASELVPSPPHDTIPGGLRDDEEDAFIDVIIAYFEAAS